MQKIFWISPNLTHYKKRVLDKFTFHENYKIVYLGIEQDVKQGYRTDHTESNLTIILEKGSKEYFAFNAHVWVKIFRMFIDQKFNYVLVPVELKFIPLIIYVYLLKKIYKFQLFTYNHSGLRGPQGKNPLIMLFRRTLFLFFDKVIFYTFGEMKLAQRFRLTKPYKSYYANNTLDTELIQNSYVFNINRSKKKNILFIGRLVPSKHIDLLFEYFFELKKHLADITLSIIGDGPESQTVQLLNTQQDCIRWFGGVVDESEISKIMGNSHVVFVPGHTGLSIVHAFSYGKPFITLSSYKFHPPEIDYLEHGENGLILSGNIRDDIPSIIELLTNEDKYQQYCINAFNKAKSLSIRNWCKQINDALRSQ